MMKLTIAALAMGVVVSGCAAIRGEPERPPYMELEAATFNADYGADAVRIYDKIRLEGGTTSATRARDFRNDVIDARLTLIDRNFLAYRSALFRNESAKNLFVDLTIIGLNTAGALQASTAIKNIMLLVSAAVTGARSAIDKDIFFEKTMVALVAKMDELRTAKELEIRRRMQEEITTYPLLKAIRDIEEYHEAGTIPAALFAVTRDAGAQTASNQVQIKELIVDTFVRDQSGELLRAFWRAPDCKQVNTKNAEDLRAWMRDNRVPTISIPAFIRGAQFKRQRDQAVAFFKLAKTCG
jgi:uncharacterized membrane protein